jgi:hypothetical protein
VAAVALRRSTAAVPVVALLQLLVRAWVPARR